MDPGEIDFDAVNRVEIYGTSVNDPGDDYTEFLVIDCEEKTIPITREMGN